MRRAAHGRLGGKGNARGAGGGGNGNITLGYIRESCATVNERAMKGARVGAHLLVAVEDPTGRALREVRRADLPYWGGRQPY
eukprot:7382593-Prymnesium_polylepis.1